MGPPEFLVVDQGTEYTSREVRESLKAQRVRLHEASSETPNVIGIVERYHAPLMLAYELVRTEAGVATSNQECLQLAVFAIDCTVSPEGLYLALLVFLSVSRPAKTRAAST